MLGTKTHRIIYVVLLTLLGGCWVTSTWATNLVWVLLGANWVFEGRWREKWQMAKESKLLQAYLALYLILLVGMLWTENQAFGWTVLQVKLPLLVLPLVMLTSAPLQERERMNVLIGFVGTVCVVAGITLVRLYSIEGLPYRDAVPYISHIRFSLCCCMTTFIACKQWKVCNNHKGAVAGRIVSAAVVLLMLATILLLRSYTAVAVLAVASLAIAIASKRRAIVISWCVVIAIGLAAIGYEVHRYYNLSPLASKPLQTQTEGGRPYTHGSNSIIECGNYLDHYVCTDELHNEWTRRSSIPYDGCTGSGYSVELTLIRYMNAIGLTKDSVGLWAMTEDQIRDVEHGIANPVYESHNPIRKMVCVMLYEHENYVHYHAVAGFTMLQRIELWHATLQVIGKHPLLGCGTGDAVDAMHQQLADNHSELTGTTKRSHNQYLSLVAMVGIIGLLIIVFMFIRPCTNSKHKQGIMMLAWIVAILVSFLTEDTLDTLAGILFCTFFLPFRKD